MAAVLAQIVLEHVSGLPRDRVINTMAFTTSSVGIVTAELDTIRDAISGFYGAIPSGHNAIAGMMGPQLKRTADASVVRFYDLTGHLDGSVHGSPVHEATFTLGAMVPGAQGLPSEIAACLSFRASYAGDAEFGAGTRPRGRDRGRIYLGPLTQSVVEQGGSGQRPHLLTSFMESAMSAAQAMIDQPGFAWCVWSRRNAAIEPVVAAWIDDAFDVQRRRGESPLTRIETP